MTGADTTGRRISHVNGCACALQYAISARLYFDLVEAQRRILVSAGSLSIPALLLTSTADSIVDWTGARDFAAAAQSGRARFVLVQEAFHELLNDPGRDDVIDTILAFGNAQLPSSR